MSPLQSAYASAWMILEEETASQHGALTPSLLQIHADVKLLAGRKVDRLWKRRCESQSFFFKHATEVSFQIPL